MAGRGSSDDGTTQRRVPDRPSPDDVATGYVRDLGAVAELRAKLATPGARTTLPLYGVPDAIVVGRGTACDWQLDDGSLSRRHAQFRWNGRALTVEDLGSANGTRVGGRPARGETPVDPGEPVQLGTVVITLELKTEPKPAAQGPTSDEATRLVQQPEHAASGAEVTQIPAAPTVVRSPPPPMGGAAKPAAAVFTPERDAAQPDEPTRSWDPRAALVKAPQKAFDWELLDSLRRLFSAHRRAFVLGAAAAAMALLLILWSAFERRPPDEDLFVQPPMPVTPRTRDVSVPAPPSRDVEPPAPALADAERAAVLADAVAAYDQGRLAEALALFRRLDADGKDPAARFMVGLIEDRLGGGAP